jgi:prepilin-type processing-associated H-X9-DG protein
VDYGYNRDNIASSKDYGFNQNDVPGLLYGPPAKINEILKPGQTIFMADTQFANAGSMNRGWHLLADTLPGSGSISSIGPLMARHGSSVNVMWGDGHANNNHCPGPMVPGMALDVQPYNPYTISPFNSSIENFWNRS